MVSFVLEKCVYVYIYIFAYGKKEEDLTLFNDTSDMGGIVGWYPPEWVTPIEISN